MKDLSLRRVSQLANVPYTACSQVLNGQLIHPEYFRRVQKAIREAPTPQEAAPA